MGAHDFLYNAEHRVVVCRRCKTCMSPGGPKQWRHHLRREPHRMKGQELARTIDLLSALDLRGQEDLRRWRPDRRVPCERVDGLAVFAGYLCACNTQECDFVTTRLDTMRDHMPRHGRVASQHGQAAPLWRSCWLQTYSTAKGRIDYFVVRPAQAAAHGAHRATATATGWGAEGGARGPPASPSASEQEVFDSVRRDARQAACDLEGKAAVVQPCGGGGGHDRAARNPWLIRTGFAIHLQGLRDDQIKSSFALPQSQGRRQRDGDGVPSVEEETAGGSEALGRVLAAAEALLRHAYGLVTDCSPGRKMTQQRAQTLSDFAWGAGKKGKDTPFRCFKNPSTLVTYFRKMKELLVYYFRVAHSEDGHFTRRHDDDDDDDDEDTAVPRDVIRPTEKQRRAMEDALDAAREQVKQETQGGVGEGEGEGEGEAVALGHGSPLVCAVRRLYVSLICHTVGSAPFQSAMLSFCAMLSRKRLHKGQRRRGVGRHDGRGGTGDDELDERERRRRNQGAWHDPGNYNSSLSALTWTAQLVLFEAVCFYNRESEDDIPGQLETLCRKFMHQREETVFGHILQWRLYLSTVAQSAIARNQARWSLDGQEIDYLGTRLHMRHVSQLVASEYRRARSLLYDDLLFGAKDIPAIEAWRVQDDLDAEDYGGSWITDPRNAHLVRGADDALLRQIEQRADLRRVFTGTDRRRESASLCRRAMAVYESHAQEFLKSAVPLLLLPPSPPIRAPELLSILYANGGRRRNLLVWEKMLMMFVRYGKSQEQTGREADNVRFVPCHIADLVLTFLAFVQPLRQAFLRQAKPGALLSPYLWSTLEGEVWKDEMVSRCLGQACARAEVPSFKIAWWRQVAASITKEKFTPKEQANFNLGDMAAPEVAEEEEPMADLAVASNHTFRTFNHAYAGTNTLVMSTLLHRGYRASLSWRTLFGIDEALAREEARCRCKGKRRREADGEAEAEAEAGLGLGLVRACKRTRLRDRPSQDIAGLTKIARVLYGDPTLGLRQPGQRDAMLACLGRAASEQVVVVLGTGSGKTLIVMVAAALQGAGTTILVLPAVALRSNMLQRLGRVGLRTVVWGPGESRPAPLVLVSAEGACSQGFLEYALRLESRQQLDRIVVDECHLTLTARYRRSMLRLGSHVRQIRTQTIWLTATLPPAFEEAFIQRNLLVRPRIVRESTNRPNLRYCVRRADGPPGGLCAAAATMVRSFTAPPGDNPEPADHAKPRAIIYCQTLGLMEELARELDCAMYAGDQAVMSEEEKEAALDAWLGPTGSPVIVATSALGIGFDYPHVRWVIHAGAPRRMTDFSQESGRAGRDGQPAESVVLLSAGWQVHPEPSDLDEEAMQLYLSQRYCSRAVMSQFLDERSEWTWCMEGRDALCEFCPRHHREGRPEELVLSLPKPEQEPEQEQEQEQEQESVIASMGEADAGHHRRSTPGTVPRDGMVFTGPDEVLRQAKVHEEVLGRLEADLEVMRTCCLLCRVGGKPFDHPAAQCSRRWGWIGAKKKAMAVCGREGRPWMEKYTACFMCYLPQTICRRADPEAEESGARQGEGGGGCRFRDMVLPLCYGAFFQQGPRAIIKAHFPRAFRNIDDYMRWLGSAAVLGDVPCIEAVRVAAVLLKELG